MTAFRCAFIKESGERCQAFPMKGREWCFNHHPDYEQQRRQRASRGGKRGGRGRGNGGELAEIKSEIKSVIEGVLEGEIKTAPAAVGLQGFNSLLRALEIERRTFDMADLIERLASLEEQAERLRGA